MFAVHVAMHVILRPHMMAFGMHGITHLPMSVIVISARLMAIIVTMSFVSGTGTDCHRQG